MGAFVVPAAEAGLTPVHSLDASRPLADAALERVFVPQDRALGEPGSAASTLGISRALQEATVGLALETVGTCDALFQLLLAYIKDRQQFGVPIGSFQAIKHKMSNMFLAIERARALCYFAVAAINEDTPNRAAAVSMAKAAADDCQSFVGRESIQTFGGIGFTWEHDCHLFVKRAATGGALFGGAAAHSLAVAASLGVGSRQADRVRPGESLIAALDLAPHPEGGWYRRTWVADAEDGTRPAGSAIYYLLLEGEVSAPHRVDATELWHFYDGDPLELRREWPDGRSDVQVLGPDVMSGQSPQVVVDAGVWQSARPLGRYALVGATVTPAFVFEGFELRQDPG